MENHIKAGNLPTAEEFLQEHHQISHFYSDKEEQMVCFSSDVQKAMIEFAKLYSIEFAKWCDERTLSDNYMDWEDYFEEFIKTKQ